MPRKSDAPAWGPAEVRRWVERHGNNVSALARRLDVPRTLLQAWLADPDTSTSARALPRYIEAHMRTLDRLELLEREGGRG